jgi:integrase/recombinase XerD
MTPLRQRFLDDLRLRNYSPRTLEAYVLRVAQFAQHFRRSPDQLGMEDVRAYQLHLLQQQASWSRFNQTVCALRFFFGVTLGRTDQVPLIPYGKRPRTLPSVLAPEEVGRLFDAAPAGRQRLRLQVLYACGLRLNELLHLRPTDVDSARMVVVVHQGKGRKDRLVPLSPRLLQELRAYWRAHRPTVWLFPGECADGTLCPVTVQRQCQVAAQRAGLTKHCTPHTLRHSYATHLLEAGVDVITLQAILGHHDLRTTAHYVHVDARRLRGAPSLLDLLALPQPPSARREGLT